MLTKVSLHLIFLNIVVRFSFPVFLPRDVIVRDNVFTTDEILEMKKLLSSEKTIWNFAGSKTGDGTSANSCYSWSSQPTPEGFVRSQAWGKLAATCVEVSGRKRTSGNDCSILAMEGEVNMKASHICGKQFIYSCTPTNSDDCVVAVIFLIEDWHRNSYGELVVYDNEEILKAVYPKPGRIVIFPASLEHVIKPPAIDLSRRLYALKVNLLVSDEKRQNQPSLQGDNRVFQQDLLPSCKLLSKANSTSNGNEVESIDLKKFLTRNFTTADGYSIVVFDDLLPARDLDALMRTVQSGGYNDMEADLNGADNVQWILGFEVEEFVQTSMWQLFSRIVTTVSGKEGYYPYDIGCNNIQKSDTTTIHRDCELHENEFTLLVYLNQNWTENQHGETVFFADMEGSEVIFALRPKYGRIAIFHGLIPHSARPPPFTFAGARFTFAVKMAPSKEIAEKKSLIVELDDLYEILDKLEGEEAINLRNIIQDVLEGKVDREVVRKIMLKYEE